MHRRNILRQRSEADALANNQRITQQLKAQALDALSRLSDDDRQEIFAQFGVRKKLKANTQ